MVKKCTLLIYFLCFNLLLIGQTNDTIYFNKLWHLCEKSDAHYYRLVQNVNNKIEITDYYLNGKIQMKASAISLEPEILDGQCAYYYPNGLMQSSGAYFNGKHIGIWNYYNSKGQLINSYNYSNNTDSLLVINKRANSVSSINDKQLSFALRGKVFGFFIIEDTYFSTATLGAEILIKGKHSLGIDFTYFGWQYERDDTKDSPLYETYERRTYAYFDYRYRFLRLSNFDIYFNLYDKLGTYHMWYEGVSVGYNNWERPWLTDKVDGTFNQIGAGLGAKYYFTDRFYLDASINGGKMFSNNNTITYVDSLNISNKEYNIKTDKNIFYIRVNFGYKLFIKNDNSSEIYYTD